MSVYAVTVVAAFAALAAAGFGSIGVWIALLSLIVNAGWTASYLARRRRLGRTPGHRRLLDRIVLLQWVLVGALGIGLSLGSVTFDLTPIEGTHPFVDALIVGVLVASLTIFLSSLVDWYWILPKVSGIVCLGPCEAPGRERWTLVTCHWFFHRALATAVFAAAAAGVPLYMLSTVESGRSQAAWFVATGAVSALVTLNNRDVIRAFRYSLNPPIHVGDVITVRIDGERGEEAQRAYIVDVSLQGAKFKILEGGRYCGARFAQKGDAPSLELQSLARARRHTLDTPLCLDGRCCGVNWYCRNNPQAYVQSPG